MKHSLKTRVLSLLLALVMVLGMAPMAVLAAEGDADASNEGAAPVTQANGSDSA